MSPLRERKSPLPVDPFPTRPSPPARRVLPILLVALAALALVPAAGAAPLSATHVASSPTTASTGTWAWGAFENASYQTEVLGAYADSLNLTSGNLSASTAVVGEVSASHALYGAYTIINATAPGSSTRSVEVSSIAVANYSAIVEVAGTLPMTGTYAPGATVPLVNVTGVYYASYVYVSAYLAFANYTLANGTVALANEHVEVWDSANYTVIIYHWPGYVNNANGSTTVTSTTAGSVSLGWVAESLSATFSPAVPLAVAPLSVGETWQANTTASIVGWAADASASAYQSGPTNTSSSNSGGWSLNTTTAMGFAFDVVGSESIVFPNGTTSSGFTIVATENGTGASAYTLWDGLAILPTSAVPATAPAAPAAAASVPSHAPVGQTSSTTSQAVVAASGFPVATTSAVSNSATLRTAPLDPREATTAIQGTPTPAAPTNAVAPVVNGPPTLAGTPPNGNSSPPSGTTTPPDNGTGAPPTAPPTTSSKGGSSAISPWILATAVAGLAVTFLGVELVLRRRRVP